MKIRLIALFLLAAVPAQAQYSRAPAQAAGAERAALLATLTQGKEIAGGGERYRLLPEVLAVERGSSEQAPQEALGLARAGSAEVIETKGRLVLYRAGGTNAAALVQRPGGATVYPTVLNVRTGTLGVLTGTLVARPKILADADAIASGHGLEKTGTFAHIRTVYYRVKPGVDIADASAALQADPRVESAYPEIIEHVRTPR